jgi:RHS repeat-associated protein
VLHRLKPMVSRLLLICLLANTLPLWGTSAYAARPPQPASGSTVAAESRKDRPVEMAERRSPTSRTFRNPNGTLSTELFTKPVHYLDRSGQFQLIDNSLIAEPDATTLRNAANRYKATFKNRIESDFFGFEYRGRSLRMALEGARPEAAQWSGNRLTYTEVLDQVDLTYTVANDYVKEEIVLKSPDAPAAFTFTLHLAGVKAEKSGRDGIRFRDAQTDEALFAIPPMFMRDAIGVLSAAVTVEAEHKGNQLRLTITPDAQWLRDADRAFPVVVDPTLALQPDIGGGLDTTIANDEGLQDLNLGFDPALSVGAGYASLLKFDLSAIPRASAIESATLKLSSLSTPPTTNTTGVPAPNLEPALSLSSSTSSLKAETYSVVYTYLTAAGETLPSPEKTIALAEDFRAIQVDTGDLPSGVTGLKVYLGQPGKELKLALTADQQPVTLAALPDDDAPPAPMVPTRAPVLTNSTTTGTLAAATYAVKYTWVTAAGESQVSPTVGIAAVAGKSVAVDVGAFPPGVTAAKIYFGRTDNERLAKTTTTSTATITAEPSSAASRPPGYAVQYTPTPTSAPSTVAVAAPTGSEGFPAGTYYVRYSYLNSLGETPASPARTVTLTDGQALQVTVGRLPVGATSANVYVGLNQTNVLEVGNVSAAKATSAQVFSTPPAAMATPAPLQAPAFLQDPIAPPQVTALTGTGPLAAGAYSVAYTFFGPNGETKASPSVSVTLAAGGSVKVTAGEPLPAGATGMRVYMGTQGKPMYLTGSQAALQSGASKPWLIVEAPPDYRIIAPPATSTFATPLYEPTVKAMTLTTATRLAAGTYYLKYTWLYRNGETKPSPEKAVTITAGQAIEVAASPLPTSAIGMRVYMSSVSGNQLLVASSMGSRTVVTGDTTAPAAPTVNTTSLALPAVNLVTPTTSSKLAAGTYSVRYTLTAQNLETAPSSAATIYAKTGQALTVVVPPLIPGMTGANVYAGASGAERLVASGVGAGTPVQIAEIPATAPAIPTAGSVAAIAPTVTAASGGVLTGDVYFSYSFVGGGKESLRSPETHLAFASPNGNAVVTTPALPSWAGAVRVYAGRAPGEGRLVAEASGSTVTVGRVPVGGIAVNAVASSWTELDATWVRATANAPWLQPGGDYHRESAALSLGGGATVSGDLTGLVRAWAAGSRPNDGILLRSQGAVAQFGSSDHTDPAVRPVLTITYREPQGGPNVILTAPVNGASVSGQVILAATVRHRDAGNTVSRVEFYANDALIGTDTASPYSFAWNMANMPPGKYRLSARAYDLWGRVGYSDWAPALVDFFDDQAAIDTATSTVLPNQQGLITLPVQQTRRTMTRVSASSAKEGEAYPAQNVLDSKTATYWRSAGQLLPTATETLHFDLKSAVKTIDLTVKPLSDKDGLTVKAQAIDATGKVVKESALYMLAQDTTFTLTHDTITFNSVRLVFGNLKRDLTTGLHHAEITEVSGTGLAVSAAAAYQGTYEPGNIKDGSAATRWVSLGQSSPTGQEYLELSLDAPADTLYLRPATPGISATIAVFRGEYQGWEPVRSIASLDEGLYPLPAGVTSDRLRIYFTNLIGQNDTEGIPTFFAGIEEVEAYRLTLLQTKAEVQSSTVTLSAPASSILLEADDSQPPGSSISYAVSDGVQWYPIIPGQPMTLPSAKSVLTVRAELDSKSPLAVPGLSAWRLYAGTATAVQVVAGSDTIPPTAEVIVPPLERLAGKVPIKVAVWDNVGVTKVELYADNDPTVLAFSEEAPFDMELDSTKLKSGGHVLWARAYDAAGNYSTPDRPTTTYQAFSDVFADYSKVDTELTTGAVYDGAAITTATQQEVTLSGTGTLSKSFSAGPGLIRAFSAIARDAAGNCLSGYFSITNGGSSILKDQVGRGECRALERTHPHTAADSSSYILYFNQEAAYTATIAYNSRLASSTPYTVSEVVSTPTVTAGYLQGVTVKANVSAPVGTTIEYFASANDGITWQPVALNQKTAFTHSGNRLRLKAKLVPSVGAGFTYANQTPQILDWSADVHQYIPTPGITVSQIEPAKGLTASVANSVFTTQWQASPTAGARYDVYRSTQASPYSSTNLIAYGVPGTTLVESTANNLLANSSFESAASVNSINNWSSNSHYHTDSAGDSVRYYYAKSDPTEQFAGQKSLKLFDDEDGASKSTYQSVTISKPAGTVFSLSAFAKGEELLESGPEVLGLQLTYTDDTTDVAWESLPGGTFDWVRRTVHITAAKPVKSVRATLKFWGLGTMWFDAVQLDTQGAAAWYLADTPVSTNTYYYQVAAVSPEGLRSSPTNEASTQPAVPIPPVDLIPGLGLKSFWSYHGVQVAGGEGYVNLASGNLVHASTDMVYPGRLMAMAFRRTYNSQAASVAGSLGYGWDHNFNWSLTPAAAGAIVLRQGDGSSFTFPLRSDGTGYDTPPGSRMRLVKMADSTFTVLRYDNNLLYRFSANGRLQAIAEPNGNALQLTYDGAGKLTTITDSTGKAITIEYTAGYISKVTHPGHTATAPRQVQYSYDTAGNLVRVFDQENNQVNYAYDANHHLIMASDANGNSTLVTYAVQAGAVAKVTHPDGGEYVFSYGKRDSATGLAPTTVTNPLSFTVTYELDANGLLKKQTYPYGTATPTGTKTASVSFEHNAVWNLVKYTDSGNNLYRIAYDGYGNVTAVTDPDNNVSRTLWTLKDHPDVDGQKLNVPVQSTDALGNTTQVHTDDRGNVLRIQDPMLHVTEHAYNIYGQRTSTTNANGQKTEYAYDPATGWLIAQTDPTDGKVQYTYDAGGNPTAVTDPIANVTRYVYDRLGRQTQVTLPDGNLLTFVYDAAGNLVQSKDPAGAKTAYEYDAMNRAVKVSQWPTLTAATPYVTTYEYDKAGRPVAVTDPRGKRSTVTYDGADRTLSESNPLNQVTTYTYDAAGNVLTVRSPLGKTAKAEYDNLHRRTTTTYGGLSLTVTYDALGRKTSQKDGLGNTSTYYYDAIGRLVTVVDPMGFGTNYAYDQVGNQVAVTDAQRRTSQFIYDKANRLVEEKRPDGVSVHTEYDAAGRPVVYTNGRNQTIGYRYDTRGQLAEISYPDARSVRYRYDAAGRMTEMTDWNGTSRWQYDLLGRLTQTDDPWGHQVVYTYDQAGNRTRMDLKYSGINLTWTYAYDNAGRLTTLQSPGVAKANTFTYDADGQLTTTAYANGDMICRTYSTAAQLTSIKAGNGSCPTVDDEGNPVYGHMTYNYLFDAAGRRTRLERKGGAALGGTVYFQYDAGSRLQASGPSSSTPNQEYYHDLVGNRHTMVVNTGEPKGVYTYVYDDVNRLIEEFGPRSAAAGGGRYHQSYMYDADGNQTRMEKDGKEVTLYYYDEDARLTKATNPLGQTTRYTYYGDGRRVRMEEPAGTTVFIYDGNDVLAEADATGSIQVAYTRMPGGQLVSEWLKGESYWYHLDALGSTVALTDESGKVKNKYGYDDYGNADASTTETIFNRYTFTGQAWDANAGLYHYKARYYNPQIGRFLTQDTYKGSAWQPWTQNLYTYVGNNPVNYVDPTGHVAVTATAGVSGAAIWFGGKLEAGLVIDDEGRVGFTFTVGYIQPGLTLGAGGGAALWAVDTIQDLTGLGGAIGGNADKYGVEVEMDAQGNPLGIGASLGAGWPLGFYTAQTRTWVWQVYDMDDEQLRKMLSFLSDAGVLKKWAEQLPAEVGQCLLETPASLADPNVTRTCVERLVPSSSPEQATAQPAAGGSYGAKRLES